MTLSLFLAESENAAPRGRTYPRRLLLSNPEDDRDADERHDKVDIEEVVEKDRSSGGQASRAGVGELVGDREMPLKSGEDGEEAGASLWVVEVVSTVIGKDSRGGYGDDLTMVE